MKDIRIIILLLAMLVLVEGHAKTYYMAPSGNDNNNGSKTAPFRTMMKAQSVVSAGDTVYLRGGTYSMQPSDVSGTDSQYDSRINGNRYWTYVSIMSKSGASGKRIKYWAYPGEKPIFDFKNIKPIDHRIFGFHVTGSWLHFRGFEIIGVQVNTLISSQSECIHNEGSNNIYEQLAMHDGMASGFYLTKGANNLVLNCDAYNNWDNYSAGKTGNNTDGFGLHPEKGSSGNVLRGCRAWFNSDDGYDCITSAEGILFDSCWAFYNGYSTSFKELGDGNGFKVGGHGANPLPKDLPSPVPSHTVRFCFSYHNKRYGIHSNHQVDRPNYYYNNISWDNKLGNYNMLSRKMVYENGKAVATEGSPGFSHVLKNNLSWNPTQGADTAFMGTCDLSYNSFSPAFKHKITAADFESIDLTYLTINRNTEGSVPSTPFMRIKANSPLVDAGKDVSFPYKGKSPDFGPFEYNLTHKDCAGIENGTATFDNCDRCIGGTTGKTACTSAGEAEVDACSYDGTIDNNNAGFKGTGFINVPNAIGSEITFHVNAVSEGSKVMGFRYASGGTADRPASVTVNGFALAANLSFPATGSFTTYKTVDVNLNLNEGRNIIQLTSTTADGLVNIDQIDYVSEGLSKGSCEDVITDITIRSKTQSLELYPNPSQSSFHIKISNPADIEIADVEGKTLKTYNNVLELEFGDDLQPGVYFAKIQNKAYKFVKY